MKTVKTEIRRGQSEGSFTLIETVIALAIVAFLIVEVAAVQGNSVVFSEYGRNTLQASWLARRVMSQVEYYATTRPFKDLQTNITDGRFEDNAEYSYALEIKEWKFPFVELLANTLGGGDDEEKGGEAPAADDSGAPDASKMLGEVIKQIFGDEPIFMTAHVDVSWAEGAARNSTGITYLLANQVKLDATIAQMKTVWDRVTKPQQKVKPDKKGGAGGPNGQGGAGGPNGSPDTSSTGGAGGDVIPP